MPSRLCSTNFDNFLTPHLAGPQHCPFILKLKRTCLISWFDYAPSSLLTNYTIALGDLMMRWCDKMVSFYWCRPGREDKLGSTCVEGRNWRYTQQFSIKVIDYFCKIVPLDNTQSQLANISLMWYWHTEFYLIYMQSQICCNATASFWLRNKSFGPFWWRFRRAYVSFGLNEVRKLPQALLVKRKTAPFGSISSASQLVTKGQVLRVTCADI